MTSQDPLLRASGICKHFVPARKLFAAPAQPIQAVDGVDLFLRRGETLALVGESGSGKSTLGRLILRLLSATRGELEFEGRALDPDAPMSPALRREIQVVFQDPRASLNPRRTIYQALRDPLLLHNLAGPAEVADVVARNLERVGLSPAVQFMQRYPRQLSGGQLQRVCISRAISLQPRLIVADEPVSALDASVRAQILQLMQKVQREDGISFLFITHDLGVVRHIAHRVAVMYLGRIVETGPVAQVFGRPAHPYTEALLSATPIPNPRTAQLRKREGLRGEIPSPADPPSGCRFHTRCPKVMGICRHSDPANLILGADRFAACHLNDPDVMVP